MHIVATKTDPWNHLQYLLLNMNWLGCFNCFIHFPLCSMVLVLMLMDPRTPDSNHNPDQLLGRMQLSRTSVLYYGISFAMHYEIGFSEILSTFWSFTIFMENIHHCILLIMLKIVYLQEVTNIIYQKHQ